MIIEYHRPTTLAEAVELLSRRHPRTVPLAGGTVINQPGADPIAVVDLQALNLTEKNQRGNQLEMGAAVTLQSLLEFPGLQPNLYHCVQLEATYNLRQVATIAGTLVSANGRSPLAAALLSLDANLRIQPGNETIPLGDFFPVRQEHLVGKLITHITIPLNVYFAYHMISRTPADQPILNVALARWPSGRTRVVVGGFGSAPRVALDGPESGGIEAAVENVCAEAGDAWATSEYRQEMAKLLAQRALADVEG
jgi:CO/xanthine dehydrogenase FAD-binding subunit